MIGLLNINSVIRKFDALKSIISGMIDVMIIVESKLDDSFPTSQFLINGYGIPFRRDRNKFGGGILIYVREDIPCKLLDRHQLPDDIEGLFVELNFRKSRLLLLGTYHPPNQKENYFFQSISQAIDIYSADYGKYIFTGDFNTEENEVAIKKFLVVHGLKNLVNVNTCFKSLEKPRCIDLFLTNNYRSFLNTCALSSGLSDFHKLVVTVMKTTFPKANPKKIFYRKYKNFDVSNFNNHLIHHLSAHAETRTSFKKFQEIFLHEVNIHAPWKQKFIRANEVPYMTKKLRKAIMTRSRLANKYHITKSLTDKEIFKKHKNYCNRLYKRERNFFFKNIFFSRTLIQILSLITRNSATL